VHVGSPASIVSESPRGNSLQCTAAAPREGESGVALVKFRTCFFPLKAFGRALPAILEGFFDRRVEVYNLGGVFEDLAL
jgi:hypothetical protein